MVTPRLLLPPTPSTTYLVTLLVVALLVILMKTVFLVGHSIFIGSYPIRIKTLVSLSCVFSCRNPKKKPLQSMRADFGDNFDMCKFQGDIQIYIFYPFFKYF